MWDKISKNPFFIITPVMAAGILIGKYFIGYPYSLWISLLLLTVYLILHNIQNRLKVTNLILILLLCAAASLRFNIASDILPENHISSLDWENISEVTGVIDEGHYKSDGRNKYALKVRKALINDKEIRSQGKILLTTGNINKRLKYGDLVKMRSELSLAPHKRNPGQFDYREYLTSKDIYHTCYINHSDQISLLSHNKGNIFIQNIIVPIKDYCENTFQLYLNDETSFLLSALLLGEKQNIDRYTVSDFVQVGVAHVLAISGLHVGFIILFVFTLLSLIRLPHVYKIYGLIVALAVYVILIQFKPSVMRASLMAVLFLIGGLKERKISVYNILFGAAFLILLFEPRELFNPGFQFSFLAVFSIVYGYQRLDLILPVRQRIKDIFLTNRMMKSMLQWIWISLLVSFSAVIGTLPLTIYYYGIISTYAVFANLIIIPLIGLIVLLGIFLLITGMISDYFANGIGLLIDFLNDILLIIVDWFSSLPYAAIDVSTPSVFIVFVLVAIIFMALNPQKRIIRKMLFGTAIIILLYFLIISIKTAYDFEVTFIDVGQGDAAYLSFPNGKTMLIDGGDANENWDNGEKTILPFLKQRGISRLDYVVATHPHNDHIGGLLSLFKRITIDTLVMSNNFSEQYQQVISKCVKNNITIKYVLKGDQLYPDQSCRVYVLHPDSDFNFIGENDGSIVLKVLYGENGILFTGDLEARGEGCVMEFGDFLESEILKVAHHGGKTSTSSEFLSHVQPLASIISVTAKNKFNHPALSTLQRLKLSGTKTYLTSQEGAIVFNISKDKIRKMDWRKAWD